MTTPQPRELNAPEHFAAATESLDRGRCHEAIAHYHAALALGADPIPTLNNLGNAHRLTGDLDRALGAYLQALGATASTVQVLTHLGVLLMDLRLLQAAEACFDRALQMEPDNASARWNRSLLLLLTERFAEGWAEYEWRWQLARFRAMRERFQGRIWTGDPVAGGVVTVFAEQGHGDTLQFIRYVPRLQAQGVEVIVRCQPALRSLLAAQGTFGTVVADNALGPASHAVCWLMSLPHLLQCGGTSPGDRPYLTADADRTVFWHDKLSKLSGRRIGLVWAGDPRPQDLHAASIDRRRSVGLSQFETLAGIAGVSFVSLQKGRAAGDAAQWPGRARLLDLSEALTDFAETAAVISNLDLVITVDTAVAHLAGALGKPVWVLSRFDGCWRWSLRGAKTRWYPTMRLFRQRQSGNWDEVMARVREALEVWATAENGEPTGHAP